MFSTKTAHELHIKWKKKYQQFLWVRFRCHFSSFFAYRGRMMFIFVIFCDVWLFELTENQNGKCVFLSLSCNSLKWIQLRLLSASSGFRNFFTNLKWKVNIFIFFFWKLYRYLRTTEFHLIASHIKMITNQNFFWLSLHSEKILWNEKVLVSWRNLKITWKTFSKVLVYFCGLSLPITAKIVVQLVPRRCF